MTEKWFQTRIRRIWSSGKCARLFVLASIAFLLVLSCQSTKETQSQSGLRDDSPSEQKKEDVDREGERAPASREPSGEASHKTHGEQPSEDQESSHEKNASEEEKLARLIREKAELEERRRELEEERKKLEEEKRRLEQMEKEKQLERQKEEERLEQEKKAKEEDENRIDEEAEKKRLLEEERKKLEEEKRRQEQIEKENRARQQKQARQAREQYLKQQELFQKAKEEYHREKKRKEREQRLARLDPEQHSFFRKEIQSSIPDPLVLNVPENYRPVIFKNERPIQLMGLSFLYKDHEQILLTNPLEVPGDETDITELVGERNGHSALMFVHKDRKIQDGKQRLSDRMIPASFFYRGNLYYIIDILSNGYETVRIQAEQYMDPEKSEGFPALIEFNVETMKLKYQ